MTATLTDASAPGRETQFYSMLGQRALYHQGWLVNTVHPPISGWGNFDQDAWELYHLEEDRSQSRNLAEQEPERLEQMKTLWSYYAGLYNGLPLDDRSALEILNTPRPEPGESRNRYVYYPDTAEVPEVVAVNVRRRSFTIAAAVVVDSADARAPCSPRAPSPADTPCTSRTVDCTTSTTGSVNGSRRSAPTERSAPAVTC